MRASIGRWVTRRQGAKKRLAALRLPGLLLALAVAVGAGRAQPFGQLQLPKPPRLSQGQVAGQFLRAVLRADYVAAYGWLAPEVRQSIGLGRFEAAARPLWQSGQRRRQEIELYKLGVRLGDGGASRLFYSFAFAADSSLKPPSVLLEVTFRDTAARAVLGFGLRRAPAPAKAAKPTRQPSRH